jgi:hypothetical protein
MRTSKIVISTSALLLLLTACGAGPDALTTMQGATGSGASSKIKEMYVQNVVIVKGETNVATVVATFINNSESADQLVNITVENPAPKSVVFSPVSEINIPAKTRITIGVTPENAHVDLIEFSPRQSSFVKITFVFKTAGILDQTVLVVPNTGIYEQSNPVSTSPQSAAVEGREIISGSLEGISISVLNGTRRSGFARSVADTLQAQSMTIATVADAPNKDTAQTQIVYGTAFRAKAEALAKLLSVGVLVEDANLTTPNLLLTLGNDAPFNL